MRSILRQKIVILPIRILNSSLSVLRAVRSVQTWAVPALFKIESPFLVISFGFKFPKYNVFKALFDFKVFSVP